MTEPLRATFGTVLYRCSVCHAPVDYVEVGEPRGPQPADERVVSGTLGPCSPCGHAGGIYCKGESRSYPFLRVCDSATRLETR